VLYDQDKGVGSMEFALQQNQYSEEDRTESGSQSESEQDQKTARARNSMIVAKSGIVGGGKS